MFLKRNVKKNVTTKKNELPVQQLKIYKLLYP